MMDITKHKLVGTAIILVGIIVFMRPFINSAAYVFMNLGSSDSVSDVVYRMVLFVVGLVVVAFGIMMIIIDPISDKNEQFPKMPVVNKDCSTCSLPKEIGEFICTECARMSEKEA